MSFWTYMLHCRDRTFYVGHTDDLEIRVAQHQAGTFGGYTARKRPVTLVWSAEFSTRDEALATEQQIKGWRREKKLALIRGDWGAISGRAKGKKGRPSTSSGQTAGGDLKRSGKPVSIFLHPHMDHLPSQEFCLEATVRRSGSRLHLRYRLTGPVYLVRAPQAAPPLRRDRLWQHTCFEAFVRREGDDYDEFNLSPSAEWAAYRFRGYREGLIPLDMESPRIRVESDRYLLELAASVAILADQPELALNLSAVIEELDGTKSYWALRHPPTGPPDFHHPDCFALTLPARGGA